MSRAKLFIDLICATLGPLTAAKASTPAHKNLRCHERVVDRTVPRIAPTFLEVVLNTVIQISKPRPFANISRCPREDW